MARLRKTQVQDPTAMLGPSSQDGQDISYLGGADDSSANPGSYLGQPTTPGGIVPPSSVSNTYQGGFSNTTSPGQMLSQNRMNIQGQGQALINQAGQAQDYYSQLQEGYRNTADQAAAAIAKQPGYSPDIAKQINTDYSQFNTSPADLQGQYLTPGEEAGVRGNAGAAMKYLDPNAINTITGTGATTFDQIAANENQWLSGNIDREGLQVDPNYAGKVSDVLGQSRSDITDATRGAGAKADAAISGASNAVSGALGEEGSSLNAAVNNPALSLTPGFQQNYQMSDQDVQDLESQADRSVGARYQAEKDDLQRNAAASGNVSPLALAAANARLQSQEATQAADAVTDARIQAKNAQAQRLMSGEQLRLGSAQEQAGMQTQAAEALGSQKVQGGLYLGGLGTEAALSGGQMNLAGGEYLGSQALSATQEEEAQRLAAKQYLTNTLEGAAATASNAYMDAAKSGVNAQLSGQEFNQGQASNLAYLTEAEQQQRENELALNRQGITTGINNTRYAQGVNSAQNTAQGAEAVGNADIAGRNTYLNYATGEQQMGQSGYLNSGQLAQSAYGTQTSGVNQAAGAQVNNMATGTSPQQWFSAVTSAAGFKDGGVVTKPTITTIGERGPEMVVPLGKRLRRYGMAA